MKISVFVIFLDVLGNHRNPEQTCLGDFTEAASGHNLGVTSARLT